MTIGNAHRAAVREIVDRLDGSDLVWAFTGSSAHFLQGVPVTVRDLDVQTDERGAYRIGELFGEAIVSPVVWHPSENIRSHFGEFRLHGVPVEIMGALQHRLPDGSWTPEFDVATQRNFVVVENRRVPVLNLECERCAYELMGRIERAALLARHARALTCDGLSSAD